MAKISSVDYEKCDMESIKKEVSEAIENGKQLHMGIYGKEGSEVRFIDPNTNKIRYLYTNGGHAMTITGMNEEGLIVATWGKRILIPFKDLEEHKDFNILQLNIFGRAEEEERKRKLVYEFLHAGDNIDWS